MTNCPKCHEPGVVAGEGFWTCESCGYVWTAKPDDYDPAEDADSELVGNPPEEPTTVAPTHGASPEPTMRVIVMDGDEVGGATLDVPGLADLLGDVFGEGA